LNINDPHKGKYLALESQVLLTAPHTRKSTKNGGQRVVVGQELISLELGTQPINLFN